MILQGRVMLAPAYSQGCRMSEKLFPKKGKKGVDKWGAVCYYIQALEGAEQKSEQSKRIWMKA